MGVVVGNSFYTLGGCAAFSVPDDFPRGTKMNGVNQVNASSMLSLSSPQFLYKY